MPGWMTVVWAVGVFGAFLASILLLLRRKQALPVFVLSLAAFLVSLLYTYVLTNGGAVMGQQMAITSAVIAALLVFFSWYSRFMTAARRAAPTAACRALSVQASKRAGAGARRSAVLALRPFELTP
ncbi:MAG: hypothetical protein M0C28_30960 [Candidatus Moduliflexus flocculans]|nr:hypothetical protein [Candidatus Moduliflexus flocculans]